jgi:hypothetical protein
VYLDTNNNGALDAGEASTTTNESGTFAFNNLAPGTYNLREVVPAGYFQTTQPLNIVLGPNQTFTCALIGDSRRYDQPVFKFRDDNRNGIQDGGEPPLADIPFVLDFNENGRYDPGVDSEIVRTNAQGIALFTDLLPDTYSVLEVFDPRVPNPFPIPTGPNPVTFDVPGPTSVPSPPRERAMDSLSSVDFLTGQTGATAGADPLTDGGLVAAKQVGGVNNSIVLDNPGAANDFKGKELEKGALAAIVPFLEAHKNDESLFVVPPKPTLSLL